MSLRHISGKAFLKICFISLFFFFYAQGEVSPLCEDLARFSCAPGAYKDGTGEVKSETEVSSLILEYTSKSRAEVRQRFKIALDAPENKYLEDLAMGAFGLKNSPQCESKVKSELVACRENMLDGLTALAQKQVLGPLIPQTGLERLGNLKDLSFVVNNSSYQKVINEFSAQVQKDLGQDALEKKIREDIFPKVQDLIVARLSKLDIPEKQKKMMINKVKGAVFDGSICDTKESRSKGGSREISSLLTPNAFYSPGQNQFGLCAGYLLQSSSEFQLVTSIAHELSHGIDPCIIAVGPEDMDFKYSETKDLRKIEAEYPIKNIIDCLRDSRSVAARNFTESPAMNNYNYQMNFNGNSGPYGMGLTGGGGIGGHNPQGGGMIGNGGGYRPPMSASSDNEPNATFCKNDQIGESFSDWMAYEVLPKYIKQNHKLTVEQYRYGYANSRRLICKIQEDGATNTGVHPVVEDRINKLLLVNPEVRAQMGCPPTHSKNLYCDPDKYVKPSEASPPTGTVPTMIPEGTRSVR